MYRKHIADAGTCCRAASKRHFANISGVKVRHALTRCFITDGSYYFLVAGELEVSEAKEGASRLVEGTLEPLQVPLWPQTFQISHLFLWFEDQYCTRGDLQTSARHTGSMACVLFQNPDFKISCFILEISSLWSRRGDQCLNRERSFFWRWFFLFWRSWRQSSEGGGRYNSVHTGIIVSIFCPSLPSKFDVSWYARAKNEC